MSTTPLSHLREKQRDSTPPAFDFGRVLGHTLSAWSCNVLPFTAIAALVYAPMLFYAFWVLQGPFDLQRIEFVDRLLLLGPAMLEPIVAGLIARAVIRQHHGKPSGVLEAIRESSRELVPLLAVTLLGAVLVAVGTLALVIPGVLLYFAYFVAGPVAVIERPGIYAALSRSADLTAGHRIKLFGLVLLIGVIGWLAYQLLLSAAKTSTTVEDLKFHIAIYYLVMINLVTLRAVTRAASYVELTGGAELPAK